MSDQREQPRVDVQHPRCPYCHDLVEPSQEKRACDGCMGWQHAECWENHGACAACGFASKVDAARVERPAPLSPEHTVGLIGAGAFFLFLGAAMLRDGVVAGILPIVLGPVLLMLAGLQLLRGRAQRAPRAEEQHKGDPE